MQFEARLIEKRYIEKSKNYYIGTDGWVYRKQDEVFKLLRGWINKTRSGKYWRTWIFYNNKTQIQIYNHILVAIYFHGGDKRSEGLLVCHGEKGNLINTEDNISWNTPFHNQVTDRKRDGNYNNRGGNGKNIIEEEVEEDLPF